jgi:Na+/melibiose symporter-like transporter
VIQVSYIITLISTCFGLLVLIFGFSGAKSAPQEAAAAALAIALAVIPYVFSRCLQITADRKVKKQRHEEIISALKVQSEQSEPLSSTGVPAVSRTDWQ